ncbi:MAG TPA: hypothetical protein VEG68_02685 [Terriglobales bacterium]|nr:hypothetical protein [Terriglobales bacterium]
MRRKTMFIAVIVIAAAATVTAASLRIYFLDDSGGGDVLWNTDSAYLFIDNIQRGYRFSYLWYPVEVLGEYFYAVPLPDAQRVHLRVFEVTSGGIQRRTIDEGTDPANSPSFYTPFGGQIYAWCPGVVCRWTGNTFESVGSSEEQNIGGMSGLSSTDFTNVKGWSKRGFGTAPVDYKFTIQVADKFEISVDNRSMIKSRFGGASIELLRPGRPPERIFYLEGNPRRVSRAEYERIFGRH